MITTILLLASTVSAPDSWDDLALRRAVVLWQTGQVDRAIEILEPEVATSDGPSDPRVDFLRAYLRHARGEGVAFAKDARALLGRSDVPEWAHVLEGLLLLNEDPAGLDPAALPAGVIDDTDLRMGSSDRSARHARLREGLDALAAARWTDAYEVLSEVERDWSIQADALRQFEDAAARGDVEGAWRAWILAGRAVDGRAVDRVRLEEKTAETLAEVLDLTSTPKTRSGSIVTRDVVTAPSPKLPTTLPLPDAAARRAVGHADEALAAARTNRSRAQRLLDEEIASARREADHVDIGAARLRDERAAAAAVRVRSAALLDRAAEMTARLAATRDVELRRIASRTATIAERARRNRLVARALRHFRVDGPSAPKGDASRTNAAAPLVSPGVILDADIALSDDLERWSRKFARSAAGLVTRSHDEVWRPRIVDGPRRIARAAERRVDRAESLAVSLAASRRSATDPVRFADSEQRVADADSLVSARAAARQALRADIARDVVSAALARHSTEGEALAYALAVASLEASLDGGFDAEQNPVTEPGPGADEARNGRSLATEAIERCERFLRDHADSPARSEVRFRLADAQLRVARTEFRTRVASFVGRQPNADDWARSDLAPFLDTSDALRSYLTILDEDPQWVHRDLVLFEAGMLLADAGDARGEALMTELVTRFPSSPNVAQAHLRLGDLRFDLGDWSAAVPHLEQAARSDDPERAAIAMYKIAWAQFAQDHFDESARTTLRLLDHYDENPDAAARTDLRDESAKHLVHSLARGGGATAFLRLFDDPAPGPHGTATTVGRGSAIETRDQDTLADLGRLLRGFSLFEDAAACDSLWLARWPLDSGALEAAERLVESRERAHGPEAARSFRLELAPSFRAGTPWSTAQSDSLSSVGDAFARRAFHAAAHARHVTARETNDPADWRAALTLYDTLIAGWDHDEEAGSYRVAAGEAAAALGDHASAVAHFDVAAQSGDPALATDAAWHAVIARDAWYETTRPASATRTDLTAPGDSIRAIVLLSAIETFVDSHPADPRGPDLLWRQGSVAYRHGWREPAADALARFGELAPDHESALDGERLRGQALYELNRFQEAGDAWRVAATRARAAGADSIATDLERQLPHCGFRHAEQRLASEDRRAATEAATLFDEAARRWPRWEHADRALYRAGLAWDAGHRSEDAVLSWTALGERYPDSEYTRDALLKIAETSERASRPIAAADALLHFSRTFPEDRDAGAALLNAVDLLSAADREARADSVRDTYLERFPADVEMAVAILEPRARRELDELEPDRPISPLLSPSDSTSPSSLSRYVRLVAEHDSLASFPLLAEVRFRRGEEARVQYERARLSQPLEPAIARKSSLLENVLEEYRASSAYSAAPWNRAAAFRIGECLVEFGDSVRDSERPPDLEAENLLAYEEILEERSWEFYDRGEEAWTALVRRAVDDEEDDDEWVAQARAALWPRMAQRFLHLPEVDFPLVAATAPAAKPTPTPDPETTR